MRSAETERAESFFYIYKFADALSFFIKNNNGMLVIIGQLAQLQDFGDDERAAYPCKTVGYFFISLQRIDDFSTAQHVQGIHLARGRSNKWLDRFHGFLVYMTLQATQLLFMKG